MLLLLRDSHRNKQLSIERAAREDYERKLEEAVQKLSAELKAWAKELLFSE